MQNSIWFVTMLYERWTVTIYDVFLISELSQRFEIFDDSFLLLIDAWDFSNTWFDAPTIFM